MQLQERFCQAPSEACGLGMVAGAAISKKRVIGFREFDVDIGFSQVFAFIHDRANLILPDVFIPATPEK
jgi:hypothetical protein